MALTLGTNAYIELDAFKEWCDMRNYDHTIYSNTDIKGAIVVSSLDFIDPRYAFKGTRIDLDQPMDLPTDLVTIADIKSGVAQSVWQQLQGQLFVDLSSIDVKGSVVSESKKLDVMEKETVYSEGSRKTKFVDISRIDDFFRDFTVGNTGGFSARRVL